MATKSIIDIEINDAAFKRYQATFAQYQALLAKTPAIWTQQTAAINSSRKSFDALVSAAAARQGYAKLTAEAEKTASLAVEKSARTWRDLAVSTKSFASNIQSATVALLKWAGVTTAVSGLLGAGGLFGIDRLAVSAAAQRRSASGLGITPGQQSAFSLNYGRLVNTEGVLSGVNTSLTDASQRSNLIRAGLSEQDLRGKNAAQVSAALIEKLKQRADQTPNSQLGNIVRALGLESLGIDEQTLRRIKDRPLSEIQQYHRDFEKDQRGLDLTPGQQTAWENLKIQLERASLQIENTFVKVLTPLTPKLEQLSAAFAKMVQTLLGGEAGKTAIDALTTGLGKFANFIGSGEFQSSVESFAHDVVVLAKAVHDAITWFTGQTPEQKKKDDQAKKDYPGDSTMQRFFRWLEEHQLDTGKGERGSKAPGFMEWFHNQFSSATPTTFQGGGGAQVIQALYRPGVGGSGGGWPTGRGGPPGGGGGVPGNGVTPQGGTTFAGLEGANGLPSGLLDAVWNAESGRGRNMLSRAGAQGHFQFMPGTWKTYGRGGNPYNLQDASQAAAAYFKSLLGRFHGDVEKAVAGYNWGEGNVEKDVRRWGDQWREHLPDETRKYLRKVLGPGGGVPNQGPGRGGGGVWARIDINNNTGGSAIVSASTLPV